jgi:general stress protein YciG
METAKEYYYTYYSYEEYGRGYIGSRKCYCLPEEDVKYLGSSKDKTFKPTQKIIFKDNYATREEAYADEIILQRYYKVVENSHFANRSYQSSTKFYVPTETLRELGKISGKKGGKVSGKITKELGIGIHGLTKEQMTENGKKGGTKTYELGIGIHSQTKEQLSENGKISARKQKELNIGIFGLTTEERKSHGLSYFQRKIGIHSLTKEQKSENGKKTKELGLGVFALTKEKMTENGRKGSKVTNSQKWVCLETGYISNSGGLSRYQKAKGIDTSKRVRVS